MRAQTIQEAESFDLFLDTICNTFGGVVFLAILLAIMIQTRSVIRDSDPSEKRATPDELRAAIVQLESLTRERESLLQAISILPPVEHPIETAAYQQLQSEAANLDTRLTAAIDNQKDHANVLAELAAANATLKEETQKVPAQVASAQAELASQEQSLKKLAMSKEKPLRMSRTRSSSAASILLLVDNGKLYLARRPTLFGRGFNDQHVTTSTGFGTAVEVLPRENAGWSLKTDEGLRELRQIIAEANSGGMTLTLAVWPNSFDHFGNLREEMTSAGILFDLWPQADSIPLRVHFGSGGSSSVQ